MTRVPAASRRSITRRTPWQRPKPGVQRQALWIERHPVISGVMGVLLAGAIGAGSAIIGANVSSNASLKIAQEQLQNSDRQKAMEQREVTYREYLNAADEFRIASTNPGFLPEPPPEQRMEILLAARMKYQKQINELYVYGSNEAWEAHVRVASHLPLMGLNEYVLDVTSDDLFEPYEFAVAYNDFLTVRCREVSAQARPSCSG